MSYLDTGGKGDVLVMLHGLGSKRQSWDFQVKDLSQHYRLIIPNLRSHSDDKIDYNITLQTMAADIINLLDKLHIKEASFLGLSLGGIVVQELLHSYPRYVKSTILSNTASILPYWAGKHAVDQRIHKLNELSKEEYEFSVTKNCLHGIYNDKYIRKISDTFLDVRKDTYEQAASAGLGINYTNTLIHNTKPMLVIGSIFDKVTPYINTITTYTLARKAKLKTFYNAGHIPNIECAEEFNEAVLDFLHNN